MGGNGRGAGVVGREGIAADSQGRLYVATDRGLLAGTTKGNTVTFTPVNSADTETASVYFDRSGKALVRLWIGPVHSRKRQRSRGRPRDGSSAGTLGRDPGRSRTAHCGFAARKACTCVLAVRIDSSPSRKWPSPMAPIRRSGSTRWDACWFPPAMDWRAGQREDGRPSPSMTAWDPAVFPRYSGTAKEISGWACWARDWRAGWATTNGRAGRTAKD